MNLTRRLRRRTLPAPPRHAGDPVSGPPSVEVAARHLRIGDDYAATLAVTGYPAEVAPGWLEPLLSYPGRLDVALHIDPVPAAVAAGRLRRQRARLESGRRASADRGQLDDPDTEAAAGDARELAYRIARGEGKLFRLGLYLTVHARSEDDLAEEVAAVRAVASSLLLVTCPATFRSLQGWVTTLPAGTDALKLTRTMDTAALAAAFPFTSPDLPRDPADPDALPGILYGANTAGPGLVAWDRWACDNHNSVTLAASGAGKSYLAKLEVLRNAYQGTECWIIDPQDEYARLAAGAGGAYQHHGADRVRLNPFDLPVPAPGARPRADALTRRALFAHTVISVLLGGQPGPAERAALDRAIMAAYHHAGITADPRTWARPAPQLPHLAAALRADAAEAAVMLADRLVPFTEGTHSGMFAGPTTTRPAGHLVVFSLRDVPDELRAVATLLALDTVWRQVSDPAARRRRLVVVDEAWLLMRNPEGARFLFRMAKAARKHWAGLAVVTQDAEDVLGSDLGRAVIANAATQVLLRQAPQAIDLAAGAFRLSAGEKALLLAAGRGEGLLACGPSARVSFQALASPAEHLLCTSDPAELAALEAAGYPGPWPDPAGPGETLPGGYPGQGSDPDEDSLL
jgi:type IV secretory pathway VirB4 component